MPLWNRGARLSPPAPVSKPTSHVRQGVGLSQSARRGGRGTKELQKRQVPRAGRTADSENRLRRWRLATHRGPLRAPCLSSRSGQITSQRLRRCRLLESSHSRCSPPVHRWSGPASSSRCRDRARTASWAQRRGGVNDRTWHASGRMQSYARRDREGDYRCAWMAPQTVPVLESKENRPPVLSSRSRRSPLVHSWSGPAPKGHAPLLLPLPRAASLSQLLSMPNRKLRATLKLAINLLFRNRHRAAAQMVGNSRVWRGTCHSSPSQPRQKESADRASQQQNR